VSPATLVLVRYVRVIAAIATARTTRTEPVICEFSCIMNVADKCSPVSESEIIYPYILVPTSQEKHWAIFTKKSLLILFREIIAAYFDNHIKYINALLAFLEELGTC
jgi:hypothetical protein